MRYRFRSRRQMHGKLRPVGVFVLAAPFLYLLGFGPACWLVAWRALPAGLVANVYLPVLVATESQPIYAMAKSYAGIGASRPAFVLAELRREIGLDDVPPVDAPADDWFEPGR